MNDIILDFIKNHTDCSIKLKSNDEMTNTAIQITMDVEKEDFQIFRLVRIIDEYLPPEIIKYILDDMYDTLIK